MKKIIVLVALIASTVAANAQVGRGAFGTVQAYATLPAKIYNNAGTLVGADTLKGVDTTYLVFPYTNKYQATFTVKTAQKAGTYAGSAYLQASTDNVNWQSITGLTAVCTTCVGASKSYSAVTTSTLNTWDAGTTNFPYYRIMITGSTSSDTTAVTGYSIYSW